MRELSMNFFKRLKGTLLDTRTLINDAQLMMVASSLAYTTILSIIPVLALSFSIFQAFGGMETLYKTIEPMLLENLAEGSDEKALQMIRGFISNIHAGALGSFGLIGMIFTCMSLFYSIEKGINRIWKSPLTRTFFQRVSAYWLIITMGPLGIAVVVGLATSHTTENMGFFAALSRYIPSGTGLFVIDIALFFALFKGVPSRHVNWEAALIGGIVTSLGWNLARVGYGIYTKNFVSYGKIYGSLGAVPVFMLWIYIAWVIILTGAALTAAFQKRFDLK